MVLTVAARLRAAPCGTLTQNLIANPTFSSDVHSDRTCHPSVHPDPPQVVPALAARLCAAPWDTVVFGVYDDDSGADGVNTALSLLGRLFATVHDGDWSASNIDPQPNARVLRTLLRQVCARHYPLLALER